MSISMGQLASMFAKAAKNADKSKELATLAQVGVGLVKREIQSMHAVDTGAMLNSTTADLVGENTYLVGPTVEYATFVALGTSKVAARPFHIEAAKKLREQAGELGFDKLGV